MDLLAFCDHKKRGRKRKPSRATRTKKGSSYASGGRDTAPGKLQRKGRRELSQRRKEGKALFHFGTRLERTGSGEVLVKQGTGRRLPGPEREVRRPFSCCEEANLWGEKGGVSPFPRKKGRKAKKETESFIKR